MTGLGYYSFCVYSPCEVALPTVNLLLDPGTNAFVLLLPPADLGTFCAGLLAEGVRVLRVGRLDDDMPDEIKLEAAPGGDSSEGALVLCEGAQADLDRTSDG